MYTKQDVNIMHIPVNISVNEVIIQRNVVPNAKSLNEACTAA